VVEVGATGSASSPGPVVPSQSSHDENLLTETEIDAGVEAVETGRRPVSARGWRRGCRRGDEALTRRQPPLCLE